MNIDQADVEKRILESRDDFKNVTILEKTFAEGTDPNDLSKIARLTWRYKKDGKSERKSFYIKAPRSSPRYEELKKAFCAETYVYGTLFAQHDRLLAHTSLGAEFYATDGQDTLILEDLSASTYKRHENGQLTAAQFAVALRKLAQLHALGAKARQSRPQIANDLLDVTPPLAAFSNDRRRAAAGRRLRELVHRADATFATQHAQLLRYLENCLPEMADGLRTKLDVLNHGNVSTKNVWFTYDELGAVVDAKFVDFRRCHWGSPVADLILFAVTSLPFEEFVETFDQMLELYTSTFNATLQQLNCDERLTVDELRSDVDSHYEYFLYVLVGIAPSDKASHDVESNEYLDADTYDKQSALWMSHIIEKGVLAKHEDVAVAIHAFVDIFEAEHRTTISGYRLNRSVLKPGDNFCSLVARLRFQYSEGGQLADGSALLKIPSLSANYDDLKRTNVYDQEIFLYRNVLPAMYATWSGQPLVPRCYAVSAAQVLVLEDLSAAGYRVCDKLLQLDLQHCRTALATIATHHAVSCAYLERCDPAVRARLTEPFNVTGAVRALSRTLYSKFLRVMRPLVAESLHRKMEALRERVPQDAIYGRYADDEGPNVVAHCDYWTNNILFAYDADGGVRSAAIIDWQLSRLASPAVDLIFFFVTSARFETFEAHREALLRFYVDAFNETLGAVGAKLRYTRAQLDDAFRRYKYYFWLYVGTELPFVMASDGSYDNEANSEVASEHFLAVAQKWARYLENEGLI